MLGAAFSTKPQIPQAFDVKVQGVSGGRLNRYANAGDIIAQLFSLWAEGKVWECLVLKTQSAKNNCLPAPEQGIYSGFRQFPLKLNFYVLLIRHSRKVFDKDQVKDRQALW